MKAISKTSNTTVEVDDAGSNRFLVKINGGFGNSYILNRALGKLKRKHNATVERTGYGAIVYIHIPNFTDTQLLADYIASQ